MLLLGPGKAALGLLRRPLWVSPRKVLSNWFADVLGFFAQVLSGCMLGLLLLLGDLKGCNAAHCFMFLQWRFTVAFQGS